MLVILDRDGVINEDSHCYIKSPQEWLPIAGSLEAIAKLKHYGATVVVATNQSGIARGLFSEETLGLIHSKMRSELRRWNVDVDGIFYCPHHPDEACLCRKPEPGLFLEIGTHFQCDLSQAICIGDSLRDIQAAQKVAAKPLLVLTGNGEKTASEMSHAPVPTFKDLAEAVASITKS